MHADDVLAGLDPEQRAVALAVDGPVCVLAGAGTGKTRAITHRIAYAVLAGRVPASAVLAVTFTARAAGEMRVRLRGLGVAGVQARTFHAAALRQLTYFWPRVAGGPMPRIVESKAGLVAEAAATLRLSASRPEIRDLAAEVEWAKASLVPPGEYAARAAAAGRAGPYAPEVTAGVLAGYEQVKRARHAMDFEDLLLITAAVVEEHSAVAQEVRSRYRAFVVDEYQDVNPLQQRLLGAWLGARRDVCVVGDAEQTIYSFTGASPRYLQDFPRRFADATVVRLVRDYRSTPEVVGLANRLVAAGPSARTALTLQAQRPSGPPPHVAEFDDEPAEAAAVAAHIGRLHAEGLGYAQAAVLFRTNAQSEAYEAALTAAGVPFLVRGAERFFDRPEVREATVLLRAAAHAAAGDEPGGLVGSVRAVLASAGWAPEPPTGSGARRERWESLSAIVGLAEDLAARGPADLDAFVAELAERAAGQHAPTLDGVTLASLHAAKGLEWDAVFLVGLVDGTVPIVHAVTAEQVAEERRLLYVGVTRAREHLWLSWARSRAPGGRGSRRPSRFLDGIVALPGSGAGGRGGGGASRAAGAGAAGRTTRRGRASAAAHCRICGARLADPLAVKLGRCARCPSDIDADLLERLKAWRTAQARELSQPAFCVFTDATLVAIAERRPASTPDLVAIPGIGAAKLARYGTAVLELVGGSAAGTAPGSATSA